MHASARLSEVEEPPCFRLTMLVNFVPEAGLVETVFAAVIRAAGNFHEREYGAPSPWPFSGRPRAPPSGPHSLFSSGDKPLSFSGSTNSATLRRASGEGRN